MTDTLILFKPLADFGEALKKDCPNECFRNNPEWWLSLEADGGVEM